MWLCLKEGGLLLREFKRKRGGIRPYSVLICSLWKTYIGTCSPCHLMASCFTSPAILLPKGMCTEQHLSTSFTLKMMIAVYPKMLQQLRHSMQLIHESLSYTLDTGCRNLRMRTEKRMFAKMGGMSGGD